MQEFTSHNPSTFCWVDLGTTDTVAAKKYYEEIFGWQPFDIPVGENEFYTMLNINGQAAAALAELQPEQKAMGIPPHWMSYVAVSDVDETMEKVKAAGGSAILEPMDVMTAGRMAMLQDPEGGVLGLWQAKEHIGASYKFIPGSLSWTEFGCRNRELSKTFYETVFGWQGLSQEMNGMVYTTFMLGEEAVAGLYEMPEEMKGVPPNWLPYFSITNIDETIKKASDLNSNVLFPATYVEGIGSFAVLQDPQGAVYGVIQSDKM